jgi:hypothetical protein
MKIKVIKERNKYIQDSQGYIFSVKFKIADITEDEILRITELSPVHIPLHPANCKITETKFLGDSKFVSSNYLLTLKTDEEGFINFEDLELIEFSFKRESDRDIYCQYIIKQFDNEIRRINEINSSVVKEETYEINSEEGIKKIYEGAKKVLDENSEEYKEIVEKNKEAWKKLANL